MDWTDFFPRRDSRFFVSLLHPFWRRDVRRDGIFGLVHAELLFVDAILEKVGDVGGNAVDEDQQRQSEGSSRRGEDWKRLSLKRRTRRRDDTLLGEKRELDHVYNEILVKYVWLSRLLDPRYQIHWDLPPIFGSDSCAGTVGHDEQKRTNWRADRFRWQPQEATRIPFTELSPDRRCPIKVSSILSSIPMDDYPPYYHHVPDSVYHLVGPFFLFIFLCSLSQYSQPLHAPIPLPLQTQMIYPMDQPLMVPESVYCDPEQQQPYDYCSTDVSQSTFLTPSELLAELAANGLPATGDEFSSDNRSESARKARRRAMAKSVGFIPTDPSVPYPSSIIPDWDRLPSFYSDTISSHEKKRHYLECLEQYVMYLHQQLELVGSQPVPLEQVSNYRGLSSRSIRVCLLSSLFFFPLWTRF